MAGHDRTTALSAQLAQTHQALRDRLRTLRRQLTTGDPPLSDRGMMPDLLDHCIGFCLALHTHHTGEDDELFPALRRDYPELAPTIDNLIEDHQLIAGILQRFRDLLARAGVDADPGPIIGEIDGLAAIMESHFAYEERRISTAVDALTSPGSDAGAPGWSTVVAPER